MLVPDANVPGCQLVTVAIGVTCLGTRRRCEI